MKKVLFLIAVLIVIPFAVVIISLKKEESKFKFNNNLHVRVKNEETGIISTVAFEDYIIGVLAGEMPITFEMEALKAQAVAARSYVMKKMIYNKEKNYDVVDTVMNQVYLSDDYLKQVWKEDYDDKINKIKLAVQQTYHEYLEYDGEVIDAMFFSTSVGKTENSEEVFSNSIPYLRSVDSSWDEISPVYEVNYKFSKDDFFSKLNLKPTDTLEIEILESTSTGRIKKIKINNLLFNGSEIVSKLNLKSNHFNIKEENNSINITTKGYGHGVGMSQYGAQAMALKGSDYKEILYHYYQGVDLKKF